MKAATKWEGHTFVQPFKAIESVEDVQKFKSSNTLGEYVRLLGDLQLAVKSQPFSSCSKKDSFTPFLKLLDRLSMLIDEVPPIPQPMRYGNTAFRVWHQKMLAIGEEFFVDFLPESVSGARVQLMAYLGDSFGSAMRLDFGTGHQLAFMWLIWALVKLQFFSKDDYRTLVQVLFYQYVWLTRKILRVYKLEPAGSHGVWGLDDNYFLPFLFGAAEMCGHEEMRLPDSINNKKLVESNAGSYMYANCVKYIMEVKTGAPLSATSPTLSNISGAASWEKVTQGMIKMYVAEVLGKHPVIKHAYFGSIITPQ